MKLFFLLVLLFLVSAIFAMKSWVPVSPESHFPIQNIPLGIFSRISDGSRSRAGAAIGEFVLDLALLASQGLLDNLGFDSRVFCESTLNSFMEYERPHWRAARSKIQELLSVDGADSRLRANPTLQQLALIPMTDVRMHMPAVVGDYTDFYSSREHATNVGIMFRGKDNALQPNWLHLPVGYHGRASSVVVSGAGVVRPSGQLAVDKDDHSKGSLFSPCRLLDFELEMGAFLGGKANALGRPLTISEAEDRIFGLTLMNDWSARDIQAWEYVPLGPFTAKNFCTSISPWIVSLDALEAFRTSSSAGPEQTNPNPLPYLQDPSYATGSYDIRLEVLLKGPTDSEASTISVSNMRYLYWNLKQQLVHHSVTGCNMRAGDLLGTGTISGPTDDSLGSMLELSWRGARDIMLNKSVENPPVRKFLKDGDTVLMTGFAQGQDFRIGFGEVTGQIYPAGSLPSASEKITSTSAEVRLRLFSYWRSSSAWRVRIALALKGLAYEYAAVDLLPLVGNTTARLPEEYRSLNPLAQVPLLEVTDKDGSISRLTQSIAIMEYLEEAFPDRTSIFPKNPLQRARARQIAEIVNSGIQPLQNLSLLRQVKSVELVSDGEPLSGDSKNFAVMAITNGLASIESIVSSVAPQSSGLFAAGTDFPTVADICLVPQIYNAKRFAVDLSLFPCIMSVVSRLESLSAFIIAAPENQPDAVK